jgi:tetratricopeptide (TPR) repeat protein
MITPPRSPFDRLRRNPSLKMILLWAAIMALTVALSWPARGAPLSAAEILATYAPLAILGIVALPLMFRLRSFAARNQRGVEFMASGDLAAAAEAFRTLSRARIGQRSIARYNLGLVLLRQGDLRGAIDALEKARTRGVRQLRSSAASFQSFCHAVLGEADRAAELAADARRLAAGPSIPSRMYLAAEAVNALRAGDAAGAVRMLDEGWSALELSTTADLVRGLRVIRAFAIESAGGDAALANDLLAGARPSRPGEYAWLGASWPELARYLEEKGFSAAA